MLIGAFAAAGLAVLAPGGLETGLVVGAVVGSTCAIQESRWYVVPGFTTFLALTLIMSTSPEPPGARFAERALETLLGVGLALLFGAVLPSVVGFIRQRSAISR